MKRGRAGGAPGAAAAVERVRVFIRLHRMLRGVRSLLVAVSGGPDSMVLLHLLDSFAPSFGVTLRAAHLHHGLRGRDADRDLALVRRTCRSLGVPLLAGRSDVRARARRMGLSFETAAREARYAFLARCAARTGAEAIALGHTADDQAETFLLRLLRGAGARGLGGIRPVRFEGPLRIVRPLLCLWRREILSVATARGVPYRTDASNRNRLFLRNRVRHGLIPYLERQFNPRAREILIRAAELLAREHDFCETHAARRYRALAQEEERRVVFPARRFAALPAALRAGLLRRALAALGTPGEVRFADAEAAARLCRVPGGGGAVCLPDGVVVSREYGELVIGRPPAAYPAYDYPLADGLEIPFPGGRLRFRVAVRARRGVGRVRRNTPGRQLERVAALRAPLAGGARRGGARREDPAPGRPVPPARCGGGARLEEGVDRREAPRAPPRRRPAPRPRPGDRLAPGAPDRGAFQGDPGDAAGARGRSGKGAMNVLQ